MSASAAIGRIVDHVEGELCAFYGFLPRARASEHLISDAWIAEAARFNLFRLDHPNERGGVYLTSESVEDELYIGIHLAQSVTVPLTRHDPICSLSDTNLDEFWVLVEEVSHFHLIINRASVGRPVSKLELEFQAEIDKVIISAIFLRTQVGDCHLLPLVRKLFDQARIVSNDYELYWKATRHAARFWFHQLQTEPQLTERLQEILRRRYDAIMQEKLLDSA